MTERLFYSQRIHGRIWEELRLVSSETFLQARRALATWAQGEPAPRLKPLYEFVKPLRCSACVALWLLEAGIASRAELRELGAARTYLAIKESHPELEESLLWVLQGAILDEDWRGLSEDEKERLRKSVMALG